ncbi:MAG: SpoIIE family protein phosphatase [Bacteroidia bacterium]|nr:SpoIIE family protein phosphatase [Bacteroidia bacterium]
MSRTWNWGPLPATLSAALFLLYLWLRYFSPYSPVGGVGLVAFLAAWVGGYALLGQYVPRRWRTPGRLLRWNALLALIGLAHTLLWGLLTLAISPDLERLSALIRGFLEVGVAIQATGHLIFISHLVLSRPRREKLWSVAGFFGLTVLLLSLRLLSPSLAPYLMPLLWLGILPLLYFSQWLEDVATRQMPEALLLTGSTVVGLFLGWQVLPSLFFSELPPLYSALYPLLLAVLFLHGGWLLIPILLRLTRLSRTDTSSLELLTDFLARQQRSSSPQETIDVTCETLRKIPAVGGVYIELRLPLEKTLVASTMGTGPLQDSLRGLLRQRSGTESYVEVLSSLQKFNRNLPDLSAVLIQRPMSLLHGAVLSQTLSVGILSRQPDGFEERDIHLLTTLTEQAALFLENLERHSYQEQLLTARKEADFLRETREALLPPPPPILKKIDYHVLFEQYDRTIGGDYYQIYEYPDGEVVDFWLSDSAGSGIAAAYQMAQARGALNTVWLRHLSPDALILEVNDALKRVFHKNNFLAATLLRFDLRRKEYILLRAGNPEVFYWNPLTEKVEILRPSGIVLGNASSQIIGRILTPERGKLLSGSLFMIFSDGFTEATNSTGEMFGTERLLDLFQTHHALPAREIASHILQAVRTFIEGHSLGDDGTLLLVRYTG